MKRIFKATTLASVILSSIGVTHYLTEGIIYSVEARTNANADDILGTWYSEKMDESYFQVKKESNNVYSAIITRSSKKDYIGKQVMKEVKFNPKSGSWKGILISPSRGIEIDAEFIPLNPKKLQVNGKVLFMSKTFYWEKK